MSEKNAIVRLTITDINNLGFGVGRMPDGKVVFVAGAADGDECDVRIIKVARDYCVGRVETLITPSPYRTDAPHCTVRGCGGCAYTAISYTHELAIKRHTVEAAFRKAGVAVEVSDVMTAGACTGYRNKAQYPVAAGRDGPPVIGFYAQKTHRVTEAAHCPLTPPVFGEIADAVRAHAVSAGVIPYDEESGKGLLRHIYLRTSAGGEEILLTLVVTEGRYPEADRLVAELTARFSSLVGILLNVNAKRTNVILGERYLTLFGRDYIYDTLAGVRLRIAPAAFYQVNHDAAELLYRKAAELAAPERDDVLLDLYCGTGSIGLSMAHRVRHLFGIEIVPEAIACARENARAAGIANATFAVGDAKTTGAILAEHGVPRPNVIVLDPPRAGCDTNLLDTVAELSPDRLVYISCNPDTLARDVALLSSLGYTFGTVTPVDLFPRTGHVESLVCLTRQTN